MVAALVEALPDPGAEVEYRRQLCRDAADAERERSWSEGYAAAVADIKRAQHGVVRAMRQHLITWDGLRENFGNPRAGDFPGGALPVSHPGKVWLAGPVVHHHKCTAACYAYEPGWYTPPESAAILATLPGNRWGEAA